jgi:hypothetical protein
MGGQYENGSWRSRVGPCGLDSSGSGKGHMASSCEHDNEPSGSIKAEELLVQLSAFHLLKKDFTLWSYYNKQHIS